MFEDVQINSAAKLIHNMNGYVIMRHRDCKCMHHSGKFTACVTSPAKGSIITRSQEEWYYSTAAQAKKAYFISVEIGEAIRTAARDKDAIDSRLSNTIDKCEAKLADIVKPSTDCTNTECVKHQSLFSDKCIAFSLSTMQNFCKHYRTT